MEICLLLELSLFQQHYAISLQISSSPKFPSSLKELVRLTEKLVKRTSVHSRSMHIQATCTVINSRTLQIYTD